MLTNGERVTVEDAMLDMEADVDLSSDETRKLLAIIDRLSSDLASAHTKLDAHRRATGELARVREELCGRLEKADADLASARGDLAKSATRYDEANNERDALRAQVVKMRTEESKARRALDHPCVEVSIGPPSAVMSVADVERVVREQAYALVERELRASKVGYAEVLYRDMGDPVDGVFLRIAESDGGTGTCSSLAEAVEKLKGGQGG